MILNILLRTAEFRGDHSADVSIAFVDLGQDETLGQLIKRIGLVEPADRIEIRIAKENRY